MMRLGRRASLLVALFLLTSAATAYAECAWIVWRQTLSDNPAVPLEATGLLKRRSRPKRVC
jgi:hypothetical protein